MEHLYFSHQNRFIFPDRQDDVPTCLSCPTLNLHCLFDNWWIHFQSHRTGNYYSFSLFCLYWNWNLQAKANDDFHRMKSNRQNLTSKIGKLKGSLHEDQMDLFEDMMNVLNETLPDEPCTPIPSWDFFNSLFFSFTAVTTIGKFHSGWLNKFKMGRDQNFRQKKFCQIEEKSALLMEENLLWDNFWDFPKISFLGNCLTFLCKKLVMKKLCNFRIRPFISNIRIRERHLHPLFPPWSSH